MQRIGRGIAFDSCDNKKKRKFINCAVSNFETDHVTNIYLQAILLPPQPNAAQHSAAYAIGDPINSLQRARVRVRVRRRRVDVSL
jgi:hypothetical protein